MRGLIAGVAIAALLALGAEPVLAQPQVPSAFYGTVVVDGNRVPDGTPVKALIDGLDCTQPTAQGAAPATVTDGGVSVYAIIVMHASQKEGCGSEGKAITFTVGTRTAVQTSVWRSSFSTPAQQLNLSVGQGSPVPLPTATLTPTQNPTQVQSTATAQAAFTPRPATALPTDSLTIVTGGSATRTVAAVNTPQAESPKRDDDGFPVLGGLLIVLGAVVLGGGAAGFALSKRSQKREPPAGDA